MDHRRDDLDPRSPQADSRSTNPKSADPKSTGTYVTRLGIPVAIAIAVTAAAFALYMG